MKQMQDVRRVFFSILFILISLILFEACKGKAPVSRAEPAKTVETVTPQEAKVEGPKVEEEVFIYERKGRRDPFVPLILKAEQKPVKGPTPLENYDVSAIKVIGIVWSEKGNYAEAVLPDGKAFTLKEGMVIGLHKGKIQRIGTDHIVIKENIKDYKGDLKSKETILRLREEEGE